MELSALAGNFRIKDQLSQREAQGLSHAYILSGPAGAGKHTLARLLAAAMVCTCPDGGRRPCGLCGPCRKVFSGIHPDVTFIPGPGESRTITVDQVRSVRSDAHIRPNEGERKVYILEGADQMNASAQNAMLKLLEEGPRYAAFLLLAENAGGLLQTVRSRCEELPLAPVPLDACVRWLADRFPQKTLEARQEAALACQGVLGRAVDLLEGPGEQAAARKEQVQKLAAAMEKGSELTLFEAAQALDVKDDRENLIRTLEELEVALIARLAAARDRRRLMRAVELTRTLRGAARLNANPGQLSGWLCAGMFLEEPL